MGFYSTPAAYVFFSILYIVKRVVDVSFASVNPALFNPLPNRKGFPSKPSSLLLTRVSIASSRGLKTSLSAPVAPQSVVKGQSVVDRLTNTQNYTGSHKQRFDAEGKGRGMAGRKEVPDKSGYVKGYKNRDSYDKTH